MKFNPIIYILINYIVAMLVTIYSIVAKLEFLEYIEKILIIIICINIIYFLIYFIIKSIKSRKDYTFELEISGDEEQIKDLLRETNADNSQNMFNNYDNSVNNNNEDMNKNLNIEYENNSFSEEDF